MRVARLGVNVADLTARPRPPRDRFTLGFFARIAPEKGLHNLAEAYRVLRTEKGLPPSRLMAAGYLPPEHKPYLERISESLRAAGLSDEFVYRGAVDRAKKVQFFHEIDVLSVPSPYREPKGLYLLEAMACGVPVVQPDHGAFPEIGIRRRRRRGDSPALGGPRSPRCARPRRRRRRAPPLHCQPHGRRCAACLPRSNSRKPTARRPVT
jgi:glycosyltransferase involved in cell wall biosynthesis